MTIKVTIQKILSNTGQGQYVLVRPIVSGQELIITERTYLDNVELEKYLDIPRKVKDDVNFDLDVYSVMLKNDHEVHRLKENSTVELIPGNLSCLPPWHLADRGLNGQLEKELSKGHILFGREVKTIARRQDNDDVLFAVFDTNFKYAKVHLTWSQSKLNDTSYPMTVIYKDWADVYNNFFIPDNKDWD